MTTPNAILVIGIGNEFRTDDGAGLLAAQKIRALKIPGVRVIEGIADGSDLLYAWEKFKIVHIIDSLQSDKNPGDIQRFNGLMDDIECEDLSSYSTHSISVSSAIKVARGLGYLPQVLTIFGIEGRNYAIGQGVSQEVAAGVDKLVDLIRIEIEEIISIPEKGRTSPKSRPGKE